MCLIEDAEGHTHMFNNQHRTARKDHKCGECWRTINKGEKYYATSGVGEDGFFSTKTCSHCKIAQEWLTKQCRGFCYGMVEEDIREHLSDHSYQSPLSLGKIAVGIKRKWQRYDGQGLMAEPKMPGEIHV